MVTSRKSFRNQRKKYLGVPGERKRECMAEVTGGEEIVHDRVNGRERYHVIHVNFPEVNCLNL